MKYGNGGLRKHMGFFGTESHYLRIPMGKSLDWNDITYSKKTKQTSHSTGWLMTTQTMDLFYKTSLKPIIHFDCLISPPGSLLFLP